MSQPQYYIFYREFNNGIYVNTIITKVLPLTRFVEKT